MFKNKIFIVCLAMSVVLLSCDKKKSYDVEGDPNTKFFTNNESLGNAPQNSISYAVVNIPNTAGAGLVNLSTTLPAAVKFPVFSTKPVGQDVVIGAELDNSLVADYNAANNTSYVALPAGILNTTGLMAHIATGATTSSDSITIATTVAGLNTLTEPSYMAPIKLTTVSNDAGQISGTKTSYVTYIVFNIEYRQIKYNAVAADAIGALLSRTGWDVTFNPAPIQTGSVIDGSTTTFSRFGVSLVDVDVNMQSSRNVTGVRLYSSNNATHIPTEVTVFLSEDGITYNRIGSPLRANLTYASSYNYIMFYKAIPAKYLRLRLTYTTSTNTQNRRVTELDVYGN